MARYPLNMLTKVPATRRVEIGGNVEIAEAFLPGEPSAAIRIGRARKRLDLRRSRPVSGKRRASTD